MKNLRSIFVLALSLACTAALGKAGAEDYSPVAEYTVAETPTWAHPVIHGDSILIKDLNHLARWRLD